MRIREIELADVSRYRGELMGAAILFIILFHVPLARNDMFFGLRRCGNIGVDMFLFLSGVGLWYSWVKHPSVKYFYRRRLLRIFPTWLVISSLFYLQRFNFETGDYVDLFLDITINWGFWLNDELTFWYMPAIMMLYLWAPLYMMLIQKHPVFRWLPVLMVCWCCIVQWVVPIHQAVGHIEIFWSRVPIFFIGINAGELVRKDTRIEPAGRWLVLITFLMTATTCIWLEQMRHGRFPLFAERMIYIPLTISLILLLDDLFRKMPKWLNHAFFFLGGVSLEIYLIHNHFVMQYLIPFRLGYWPTVLLTIVLTLPLAWLLQQIIKRLLPA